MLELRKCVAFVGGNEEGRGRLWIFKLQSLETTRVKSPSRGIGLQARP